jgi:hypothetical protein
VARGALLLAGGALTEILIGTEGGIHRPGGGVDLDGRSITALTADRWGVWALADGRDLYRRTAGPWVEVEEVSGAPGRCLLAVEEGLYVGTAEAGLLRLEEGVLDEVAGFAEVPGRDGWYTPWGGPPDTRSMARGADGALLANVHVGGIPRSRDGGTTWEPTIDVDADVHQVIAHPTDPSVALAACAGGLAESRDGGDAWEIAADGLHAPYCRAVALAGDDPAAPDTVLVTASTGPRTDRAAVYRRPLSGGAFERCTEGLPEWFASNIDSHCLAAAGPSVVLGSGDGVVYRSDDGGGTWQKEAEGLPPIICLAIAPARD